MSDPKPQAELTRRQKTLVVTLAIIFAMYVLGSMIEKPSRPLSDRELTQAGADQIDAYCSSTDTC